MSRNHHRNGCLWGGGRMCKVTERPVGRGPSSVCLSSFLLQGVRSATLCSSGVSATDNATRIRLSGGTLGLRTCSSTASTSSTERRARFQPNLSTFFLLTGISWKQICNGRPSRRRSTRRRETPLRTSQRIAHAATDMQRVW